MNILLENYKKENYLEKIIESYFHFEKIHPFEDGNGRVGRLLMFKECLKNNVIPFVIDEEHRLFYYRGLKEYPNTKGFLIDTCLSCQDKFKEILEYFEIKISNNPQAQNTQEYLNEKSNSHIKRKKNEKFSQSKEYK